MAQTAQPPAEPALTELERLTLENLNLKKFALELQLHRVLDERASFVKALEENRPGWRWNEQQGFVWQQAAGPINGPTQ